MFNTGKKSSGEGKLAAVAPIKSMAALAELVNRNVGTVSRWTNRVDWPFKRSAPWPKKDVPKILKWVAETLPLIDAPATARSDIETRELRKKKLTEEIRKFRAHADIAELELARERGKLVLGEEVEIAWSKIMRDIRSRFENLGSQAIPMLMGQGLPHQAAPYVQDQLEQMVAAILQILSTTTTSDDNEIPQPPTPAAPAEMENV